MEMASRQLNVIAQSSEVRSGLETKPQAVWQKVKSWDGLKWFGESVPVL